MSTSLTEVQTAYTKWNLMIFLDLFMAGAVVVCIFAMPFLVPIFLVAAVILYFAGVRVSRREYEHAVNTVTLLRTVGQTLFAQEVKENGGEKITEETIRAADLMACDSRSGLMFRWELSGERDGIQTALCDVNIPQKYQTADSNKDRLSSNAGIWVHMDLPDDTGWNVRILDYNSVLVTSREDFFFKRPDPYEEIHVKEEAFRDRLFFYRPKGSRFVPSERLIVWLRRFIAYTPGYAAISIRRNHIDAFIHGRFLSRMVKMSERPDATRLDVDPFPELSDLIRLANLALGRDEPEEEAEPASEGTPVSEGAPGPESVPEPKSDDVPTPEGAPEPKTDDAPED